MENVIKKNEWKVRFEVTFYGNDPTKGSFREIKEDTIVINEEFQIKNNCNSEVLLPQKKIKKIFSDLNIEIYDLTNNFWKESEKKLFLNYDPVHLSEDGHKLVSESIIKKIY